MKININQTAKIEAALSAVNGRSERHCYTTAEEIISIAQRTEKKLEKLNIPKNERSGAFVRSVSGDIMPNSYKGLRNVTSITLLRGVKEWFLTGCYRSELWPNQSGSEVLHITVAQHNTALKHFNSQFTVISG